MLAVTRNAYTMIAEIRRQFNERPGVLEGTETPDYERCVRIASRDALKALVVPALIAVVLPLVVGFILGRARSAASWAGASSPASSSRS